MSGSARGVGQTALVDDAQVLDFSSHQQQREGAQASALLALFSEVLSKPLVLRELSPVQQQQRKERVEQRRQQRQVRLATATGTLR